MEYIIASYPRSGNLWVRYLIEWFSKRPTIGEGNDYSWDPPLYTRKELSHIKIENKDPLAVKRHWIRDSDDRSLGLILVIRNYNECILKHLQIKDIDSLYKKQHQLIENINQYTALLYHFEQWNKNKLIIYYEDLIDDYCEEIQRLLKFCNIFNDTEFKLFMHNYHQHRNSTVNYYDQEAGSETKGLLKVYYINFIPDDQKTLIQNYLVEKHTYIFNKYLSRYLL